MHTMQEKVNVGIYNEEQYSFKSIVEVKETIKKYFIRPNRLT